MSKFTFPVFRVDFRRRQRTLFLLFHPTVRLVPSGFSVASSHEGWRKRWYSTPWKTKFTHRQEKKIESSMTYPLKAHVLRRKRTQRHCYYYSSGRLWRGVEFQSANASSPPRSSPLLCQAWLSVGWNYKCASDIPCFKLMAKSVDLNLIWIYFLSHHHDREAVLSMGSVWVKRKVWKQC